MVKTQEPIIALSTADGAAAIHVIRLSGSGCIEIVDKYCSKSLSKFDSHSAVYCHLGESQDQIIDECVVTIFRSPKSYTKEDVVEISCHGSPYITQSILSLFLRSGVRMAEAGEFTMRAYLNGQMDLTQAEAVADLIAARSKGQHHMAMSQLRGIFSAKIQDLRAQLIHFASMIELENDFAEEDVEFADRGELKDLVARMINLIKELTDSFRYGNAIKNGVPVAIVGPPNAGKSTLLNALLQDDKAIVSAIAGTTRDYIEDSTQIDGISFRFIDTAGIRQTDDEIESQGIKRSYEQMARARLVLYITEIREDHQDIVREIKELKISEDAEIVVLLNKIDTFHACHAYDVEEAVSTLIGRQPVLSLSAKSELHMDKLKEILVQRIKGSIDNHDIVVSNARHQQELLQAGSSLKAVIEGLNSGIPTDLIAIDLRHATAHLGSIMGEVTTDDLLENIFRNFCIGK